MISTGTPFDSLFADLSDRMGVLHSTDTDPSQRDRVVWERAGAPVPERCPYQLAGRKVIGQLAHPWTATVYGASDLEVVQYLGDFWGKLDELQGPPQGAADAGPGYKFEPGKIGLQGGDGTSAGWACPVSVTLYTLVVKQVYPLAEGAASLATTPLSPEALTGTAASWPA